MSTFASMKVKDLREELGKRGLDIKGVKDDLIQRLEEHEGSSSGSDGSDGAAELASPSVSAGAEGKSKKSGKGAADKKRKAATSEPMYLTAEVENERAAIRSALAEAEEVVVKAKDEATSKDDAIQDSIKENEAEIQKLKDHAENLAAKNAELQTLYESRSNWTEHAAADQAANAQRQALQDVGTGMSPWFKRRLHAKWCEKIQADMVDAGGAGSSDVASIVADIFGSPDTPAPAAENATDKGQNPVESDGTPPPEDNASPISADVSPAGADVQDVPRREDDEMIDGEYDQTQHEIAID